MNYKKLICCFSLACSNLFGVTIAMDEGTGTGHMVVDTAGVRLAEGSLIRWGYMSGTGITGDGISTTNFVQFATTTVTNIAASGAAATTFGFIRNDITTAGTLPVIAGKQLFMWVYNSAVASNSVAQALFTSVGWVAPATFATNAAATYNITLGQPSSGTPPVPVVTTVSIDGINNGSFTTGNVRVLTTTNPVGAIYALGSPIPETSTSLLGAIGALALLRRRRN